MPLLLGWEMGFEPTIFGTTIRRFNQLSYTHHRKINKNEASHQIGNIQREVSEWRALLDSNQRLTA